MEFLQRLQNSALVLWVAESDWGYPIVLTIHSIGMALVMELLIRGMRLQLESVDPGARSIKGMLAGYYDLKSWWDYTAKVEIDMGVGHYSCPAMYEAAQRLADGYPDAKTGACTALSSAFKIEVVPAFIAHIAAGRERGKAR